MLLNKACAWSDVRAGSLHLLCREMFQPYSGFLGLCSQGVLSLWQHTEPPWPLSGWSYTEAEAGHGPAMDWVLRLVAVNRGRMQDEVFSCASAKAIEIPSCANLHCSHNSSVKAFSKHVLVRIILLFPFAPMYDTNAITWQTLSCSVSDGQIFMIDHLNLIVHNK